MRGPNRISWIAQVWLTMATALVAATPHCRCVCPDGHVKPFCLSGLLGRAVAAVGLRPFAPEPVPPGADAGRAAGEEARPTTQRSQLPMSARSNSGSLSAGGSRAANWPAAASRLSASASAEKSQAARSAWASFSSRPSWASQA